MVTPAETLALAKKLKGVVDGLAEAGGRNDRAADAAFAEEMDWVSVENSRQISELGDANSELRQSLEEVRAGVQKLHDFIFRAFPAWEDKSQDERPLGFDLSAALVRFLEDGARAGSNAKRRLLFSALIGEFNPEFYKDGWNRIFGGIARELQPPHVAELRQIIAERKGNSRAMIARDMGQSGFLLVKDLARFHLVVSSGEQGTLVVEATHSGKRFLEYLWNYDEEEPDATAAASR